MSRPNLLNDILFKIVFGGDQAEKTTLYLLNALLDLTGKSRIRRLQILNPHIEKEYLAEKGAILDVRAQDGLGQLYNIEVQLNPGDAYVNRSLYYLARLYGGQLEQGDFYSSLARTVGISLLDFVLFPEREPLHSRFVFYEPEQQFALTDILELHYIELQKFSPRKPEELHTPFERWLYILRFSDLYQEDLTGLPENLKREEGIVTAMESMKRAYARDEIRELMEAREKAERDRLSNLHAARQQGLHEGRQEGLQQGLQVGRQEREREIAQQLRAMGMAPAEIARITGLPVSEL